MHSFVKLGGVASGQTFKHSSRNLTTTDVHVPRGLSWLASIFSLLMICVDERRKLNPLISAASPPSCRKSGIEDDP